MKKKLNSIQIPTSDLAEILFITSYPPRKCSVADYSHDLIKSLNDKFRTSFVIKVCALEAGYSNYDYPEEVKYILDTSQSGHYSRLASDINKSSRIKIVFIQHEFGFFHGQEEAFHRFIDELIVPVGIVFHTVLPNPDQRLKSKIQNIAAVCQSIVVMTNNAARILMEDYDIFHRKINVIPYGTHLVSHLSESFLKEKYGFKDRKVLTTFGLLGSGKSIETTLEALPAVVKNTPEVLFLIIGKNHPEVVKQEGETYRNMLEEMARKLGVQDHVRFINSDLSLPELLEYLQLTDVYLFTSNDPNQAVSGTFAYAMECACPIISTPIPHGRKVLTENAGIIYDFQNPAQLAESVIRLFSNDQLQRSFSTNSLHKIVSTAWENSAVAHARLFEKMGDGKIVLRYYQPDINLNHLKRMTTDVGIIQFSKINQPDIESGYTLNDNARALIVMCMHFQLTSDEESISYIRKYLDFIKMCQKPNGSFLNYLDQNTRFTDQNRTVNLDDSNGRAVWALGYVVSSIGVLPAEIVSEAETIFEKSQAHLSQIHSTRAMAFSIKGLYFNYIALRDSEDVILLKLLADRLVQLYKHESDKNWEWFEGYLTYENSILPEAMLYAWLVSRETVYRDIAISSFNFLLSHTYSENGIEVISNRSWFLQDEDVGQFGEQPIDVACTIMTLSVFYDVFHDEEYFQKMVTAFNWFLGNNRLRQIVYNPCTGGCYDGLEENNINLNQGAESTISYLMARLTIEKYKFQKDRPKVKLQNRIRSHIKKREDIYSNNSEFK